MFNRFMMILLIALLIFVSGCQQEETKTVLPTVPVKTIKASLGSIEVSREFTGGLVGEEQAEINIRISEAITDLPYKEGDYVKKGDVIVRLDRGGATSGYYQAEHWLLKLHVLKCCE